MPSEAHSSMTRNPAENSSADLDRLGDQIAELSAHIQAATYRLLVLIREFDARDGWRIGFRSCAHWLNWRTGLDPGTAGDRYQVVVHVGAEASADSRKQNSKEHTERTPENREFDDGTAENGVAGDERLAPGGLGTGELDSGVHVSAETSRRLACESARVVMTHGSDGKVLDVGRKTRAVHPALQRALTHRDKGCRFPGCGLRQCDAHHVEHWADGGKTKLDNLLLLCRHHHRAVHEGGYRVELDAVGEPCFTAPAGWVMTKAPGAPALQGDPAVSLTRSHQTQGLRIDHSTNLPRWQGERLDLAFTIDAFRNYFS